MASLLEFGSKLSMVKQSYFDQYIKLKLGPAKGLEAIAHNFFDPKGANAGVIPITGHFEMALKFLGF